MKKHTLTAAARDTVGRKVKNLRKQGVVPATLYGKKVKSMTLSVVLDEFDKVYQEAGESGLVDLSIGKEVRPVLVHNVQKDPMRGTPLHVEFFQVDLKEKVHTKVPLVFTGEPLAVAQKQGVLLTILDEIEVEALPTDLPEKIEVDVSTLAAVDQEVRVSDLKALKGVTIISDTSLTVVKISALVTKEAEAEAAAEEAAKAAAAAESVTASEAPATGEEGKAPANEDGKGAPEQKTPPEEKKE